LNKPIPAKLYSARKGCDIVLRQKVLITAILALLFCLFITAPIIASSIWHTSVYELEGAISFKKQAGHYCNTGAEFKQVISGSGKMDKTQTVTQVKGKLTMDDKNDWVAGATPLTVTSVWKLCTPPKYTYYDSDETYGYDVPVDIDSIYKNRSVPAQWNSQTGKMEGETHAMLAEANGWDAVSEQFWAVQVHANPGSSGNLQQNGVAAYGPHGTLYGKDDRKGGKYYVGDFFNISQQSRVNDGVLKRYIDISSPVGHGYLHEDMSVVGKTSIRESFRLTNYSAGTGVSGKWYNLF
jgi:hypothetical protein